MITGAPDLDDVRRYFAALRRAQHDIDLRPELYTKHYRREFPERFHATMDTRRWGPGERLVFEPYTREAFEGAFNWIAERDRGAVAGRRPRQRIGSTRRGRRAGTPARQVTAAMKADGRWHQPAGAAV